MIAPVVLIGGSRGGIEALTEAFAALPSLLRAPIAVVLHRRADSTVSLANLVARRIHRAVIEPDDDEPFLPGRVYLAPADYHLLVEPASLRLDLSEPVFYARPSIDVLFDSAAASYGSRAVAILLSGASEDGAEGLARVVEGGGVAIVQDPDSAASPIAPRAAIGRIRGLEVLTPSAIGRFLAERCR